MAGARRGSGVRARIDPHRAPKDAGRICDFTLNAVGILEGLRSSDLHI